MIENTKYNLDFEDCIFDESSDEYELLEKCDICIAQIHRSAEAAKLKLMQKARLFGGNSVTDVKIKPFLKNSIGFSIQMYEASGKVCLIGKKDENGEFSRKDLEGSINTAQIEQYSESQKKAKKIQFLFKFLGIVLFCIFAIGFFMSK